MASASKLAASRPSRILCMGEPGTAKTGSLAALANAGYKLRILDFDNNIKPLLSYVEQAKLKNVDIITLQDNLTQTDIGVITTKGAPKALRNAVKALDDWPTDNDKSLGSVYDWGLDTVLVVDSLTRVGDAAMNRVLHLNGRNAQTRVIADWGTAIAEQAAFIKLVTNSNIPCHVIVMAHLKMVAPKAPMKGKGESDAVFDLKVEYLENFGNLIPTRLYPNVLGQDYPLWAAGDFECALLYETQKVGANEKRIIRTVPMPAVCGIKVPAEGLPATLPIETGLLTVLSALTHNNGEKPNGKAK